MPRYHRYMVSVEFALTLKDDAIVAHNDGSVAEAVRHYLRQVLPGRYTPGGYQFMKETIFVEAKGE